jgi:hypothetical protein
MLEHDLSLRATLPGGPAPPPAFAGRLAGPYRAERWSISIRLRPLSWNDRRGSVILRLRENRRQWVRLRHCCGSPTAQASSLGRGEPLDGTAASTESWRWSAGRSASRHGSRPWTCRSAARISETGFPRGAQTRAGAQNQISGQEGPDGGSAVNAVGVPDARSQACQERSGLSQSTREQISWCRLSTMNFTSAMAGLTAH